MVGPDLLVPGRSDIQVWPWRIEQLGCDSLAEGLSDWSDPLSSGQLDSIYFTPVAGDQQGVLS
jgi:hypothetical protein